MPKPPNRRNNRGAAGGPLRAGNDLVKAFLARLAPHGPVPVLVFAYFLTLVGLGYFASQQTFSESVTIALGFFGLVALGGYLGYEASRSKAEVNEGEAGAKAVVAEGQEQRRARRAKLPPPPQLSLELKRNGEKHPSRENGDDQS